MDAIGPRVGGAHVDVNLKFDEKSIGRVGKQIHRQLSKLGNSLAQIGERNGEIYRSIGRDAVVAWRSLLGTIVTGAPLIGSALSAVAGTATILAGALYSAGQSAYGFAPLLAAVGIAAGTAAIGLNGFIAAVKSGELDGLTPSAKASARAIRSLDSAWQSLRDTVQENFFKGLAGPIRELGFTLFPVLEQGLGKMATALNGLAKSLLDYVNSAPGLKQIGLLLDNSADIFDRFAQAVVPALDGVLRLLNALTPAGKRLADRIAEVARRFQSWTQAAGFGERIDSMMKRAEKTAGLLLKVLGNLGSAIVNIFNAANPATNTFLQMLVDVTQRFSDWTSSVEGQKAIADWAMNSVDVMRQFGNTLSAVFDVISRLSDPRVIISFLKTVEGAFEYLSTLPLEKMVDAFVKLADAIQPISSLFLAIIIAGAGFNIMIGSIVGQLGGLFNVLGKLASPLRNLFTPLASAGKHGKELTGLAAALGRVSGVLGRLAKFVPYVGWAAWVAMLIAKSDDLKKKLGDLWSAVQDFGQSFKDAFAEIGEALEPLAPAIEGTGEAIGWLLDKIDAFAGVIVSNGLTLLTHTFQGLANVVRGLGKTIAGLINIVIGLFDVFRGGSPDKLLKGLQQLGSGILRIFLGLGETLIAPVLAAFETVGGAIMEGVLSGLEALGGAIVDFGGWLIEGLVQGIQNGAGLVVSAFEWLVTTVISTVANLPSRLLTLGKKAISLLGIAIRTGVSLLRKIAGNIFSAVVGWIVRLPGRLASLGKQTVTFLANAVRTGVRRLKDIAGNIFKAVVNALKNLPGDLFDLGKKVVSKFAEAVRTGVSRSKNIAGNIFDAIYDKIKSLPGDMLEIGKEIVGQLVSGLTSRLDKLKGVADKIGSTIKKFLPGSPVEEGPLRSWNYGSGASGGGRNVIDAIASGLRDTSPIRDAMRGVANAMSTSAGTPGTSARGRAGGTSSVRFPDRLILRIGDRDFVAYVGDIADSRIDAADSLGWQGA